MTVTESTARHPPLSRGMTGPARANPESTPTVKQMPPTAYKRFRSRGAGSGDAVTAGETDGDSSRHPAVEKGTREDESLGMVLWNSVRGSPTRCPRQP